MSELSRDARALVARARRRDGPSPDDRARLRQRLESTWACRRDEGAADELQEAVALAPSPRGLQPTAAAMLIVSLGFLAPEPARLLPPAAATARASRPTVAETIAAGDPRGPQSMAANDQPLEAPGLALDLEPASAVALNQPNRLPRGVETLQPSAAPSAIETPPRAQPVPAVARARPSVARVDARDRSVRAQPDVTPMEAADRSMRSQAGGRTRAGLAPRMPTVVAEAATEPGAREVGEPSPSAPRALAEGEARDGEIGLTVTERGFDPQPIDDELAWLGAAQDALRDGQPSRALSLVQQHAFRYPRGALAPERSAVQALALCALERKQAARSVLADLERRTPSSPLVDRVRRRCGL